MYIMYIILHFYMYIMYIIFHFYFVLLLGTVNLDSVPTSLCTHTLKLQTKHQAVSTHFKVLGSTRPGWTHDPPHANHYTTDGLIYRLVIKRKEIQNMHKIGEY
jgi:hypothetical protein